MKKLDQEITELTIEAKQGERAKEELESRYQV